MPKLSHQHVYLSFSAAAIVALAGFAVASYHAHKTGTLAARTTSPNTTNGLAPATNSPAPYSASNSGSSAGAQSAGRANTQATTGSSQDLYLSPTGTTLATGSTLTVQIRENSGITPVNAVQANLSYPADKLKFMSTDAGSSAFAIAAPGTNSGGKITVARGSTTALTGDQAVATLTFTVLAPGDATLAFSNGSALVSSTTHTNLLGALGSTKYHIK
jgi:hypothetical protein